MLDFLNQNSGALTVIFTGVVTLSTLVYAVLTVFLVAETRRMRQVQTEPRVEVVLKPRDEWINLVHLYIRNIGLGSAYNISFEISAEAGGEGAKALIQDFTRAQFFATGMRYLGPGQEVPSAFSLMTDKSEAKIESVLIIAIRYKGLTGKDYADRYRLDFSELKGRTQVGTPPLYAIAQHLDKIQQDFSRVAKECNRIKVDAFTNEDREKEEKEWEQQQEQIKKKSDEGS